MKTGSLSNLNAQFGIFMMISPGRQSQSQPITTIRLVPQADNKLANWHLALEPALASVWTGPY